MKSKNIFKKSTSDKRSPIKAPPLRSAGQSIDEEIHRIQSEEIGPYVAMILFMFLIAVLEWWKWFRDLPPKPILTSVMSLILIAFGITKIFSFRKDIQNLRLGREGEKAVGEFLDRLREKGYRIFHDIVGGDFNIDHVLIGETGIYTIETKTYSKPSKGAPHINYDGEKVMIGNYAPDRNPIPQAKAQANWLKELMVDLTGKNIKVQPVVLYPGWFVNKIPKGVKVWVLNPKVLPDFLEKEDTILDKNEIPSIASHLSRYVRNLQR